MTITNSRCPIVSSGATLNGAVNFADSLYSGELLTGTPTAAEQTTSDLTISSVAVNTAALTILEESVSIGQAVQFSVSGQVSGKVYTILVTVSTDSSPAQTLTELYTFICE